MCTFTKTIRKAASDIVLFFGFFPFIKILLLMFFIMIVMSFNTFGGAENPRYNFTHDGSA